jgi:hypothetical protein
LVVDPSPQVRRIVVEQLKALGYQASSTSCIDAALAEIEAGGADLLFIHLSGFSSASQSRLARTLNAHRGVSLVASLLVMRAASDNIPDLASWAWSKPTPGTRSSPWRLAHSRVFLSTLGHLARGPKRASGN